MAERELCFLALTSWATVTFRACLFSVHKPLSTNTKGQHEHDWALVSAGWGSPTPRWEPSQEKADISGGNIRNVLYPPKTSACQHSSGLITTVLTKRKVWRLRLAFVPSQAKAFYTLLRNTLIHISNGRLTTRHVRKTVTICCKHKRSQVFP